MTSLGLCAFCGTPLTPEGSRRCDCAPASELEISTRVGAVLAAHESPARDGRAQGRWMKRVAASRRAERN